MEETGTKLRVLCPVSSKDGKTFWLRMGAGFRNRDKSINIYLDGLPVNGKLQLREWDEPLPWERKGGAGGDAAPAAGASGTQDSMPF